MDVEGTRRFRDGRSLPDDFGNEAISQAESRGRTRTHVNDEASVRRRILVVNGHWTLVDFTCSEMIPLESLFDECRWNLDRLSRLIGIGRRTLARTIDSSLGINGKLWLRQLRMVKACKLLREGRKITHVSQCLGFRHQPDFTREFRLIVGVSPSFYQSSEKRRMFDPSSLIE